MPLPLVQTRHLDGKWDLKVQAHLFVQPRVNHFVRGPLPDLKLVGGGCCLLSFSETPGWYDPRSGVLGSTTVITIRFGVSPA